MLRVRSGLDHRAHAGLAATLIDHDHDGDLDVHVVAPLALVDDRWVASHWLCRNDGHGRFTDATDAAGLDFELGE